jgi:hypothetical protein
MKEDHESKKHPGARNCRQQAVSSQFSGHPKTGGVIVSVRICHLVQPSLAGRSWGVTVLFKLMDGAV